MGSTTAVNSSNVQMCPVQDDVINSCRVCMSRKNNMKQIFEGGCGTVSERVLYCTGVQFTRADGFPTKICEPCLDNLAIAHEFKTNCILADELLRKLLLKTSIKSEEKEINFNDFDDDLLDYDNDVEENKIKEEIEGMKVENIKKEQKRNDFQVPTRVRTSGRIRLKKENKQRNAAESTNIKTTDSLKKRGPYKSKMKLNTKPTKADMKRGPYNKTGLPRRMPKFKFRKLHCETCDIKFANRTESERHKKEVHKDDDNWVCEICGKMFPHRASAYYHTRSHLPPQYACDYCDYNTWNKHDLVKHVRIHTGTKTFQCEICSKAYHTSSNLWDHIRRFHQGMTRFQCTMCERRFYDRTKLNRHIDSHNDVKRFECEVCHSCFTRRDYWKKHLLRNHGVVVPAQRPGRQKVNLLLDRLSASSSLFTASLSKNVEEQTTIAAKVL